MFVEGIYVVFLGKLLVYNCLFLFNWRVNFSDKEIVIFQKEFGKMGYRYQFIILVGFYFLNYVIFKFVCDYKENGMFVYIKI